MLVKILFIGTVLAGYLAYPASAFSLERTGCRFSVNQVDLTETVEATAPAMAYLAAMARSRDNGDVKAGEAAARRAARLIATYPPRTVEVFLGVVDTLSPHVVSDEAHGALTRGLLDHLRPIDGQAFETDTGILRAYLKAHYRFHRFETDRYQGTSKNRPFVGG
jgi:hypothetical protein